MSQKWVFRAPKTNKKDYRILIDKYLIDIKRLRNQIRLGGTRRVTSEIKSGIPPRVARATTYISDSADAADLKMWRSVATRRDLEERLNHYFDARPVYCDDEISDKARTMVISALSKQTCGKKVRPLSYCAAFKSVPQDTSPGFPWTRVGISEKRDAHMVFERLRYIEKRLFAKGLELAPCLAQARLPLCPRGENKPRLVWAYPMEVSMMEACFALPLIKLLSNNKYFAWSYNWLAGYGQYHFKHMNVGRGIKCGIDWKRFDAEIHPKDLAWGLKVLEGMIDFPDDKSRQRWKLVCSYLIETPIYFYDSLVLVKGGIPSGSFFTQILGTVLNMYYTCNIFLRLSRIRTYVEYDTFDELFSFAVFLGDDSSMNVDFCGQFDDRKVLTKIAADVLGKTLHPEKGFFYPRREQDMEFEFLGKMITGYTEVKIERELCLAQLIYPENPDKDPGDVLTRCIGVAWMAGTDKVCYQICQLVWDHVKEKYPYAQPTPFKRDLRDVFKFMLNMKTPQLTLPTYRTLYYRYICQ